MYDTRFARAKVTYVDDAEYADVEVVIQWEGSGDTIVAEVLFAARLTRIGGADMRYMWSTDVRAIAMRYDRNNRHLHAVERRPYIGTLTALGNNFEMFMCESQWVHGGVWYVFFFILRVLISDVANFLGMWNSRHFAERWRQ